MPGTARQPAPGTLGAEVRRLRERTGRKIREVADELGWSQSKLSRLETASSGVKDQDLVRLLGLYGVADDERTRIRSLAQEQRHRRSTSALPDAYETYVRLEETATAISIYGAIVVPGLLQTPEYAAAVFKATPTPEDHFIKERMTTRMVRQAVLGLQPPPRLQVVIDEAVLRRPIGGDDVMRRQMLRLRELSERPDMTIQILPFAVGAHPALTGQFAILDFASDGPPHVFCDGLTGGVLRGKAEDVQRYRACFSKLTTLALNVEESVQMFAAIADGERADQASSPSRR